VALLNQYLDEYASLNDQNADMLVNSAFKNDMDLDKLNEKYYKKFSKAIGPLQAAKLMQIEGYLHNVVQLSIQDQLPFIGEIKK